MGVREARGDGNLAKAPVVRETPQMAKGSSSVEKFLGSWLFQQIIPK